MTEKSVKWTENSEKLTEYAVNELNIQRNETKKYPGQMNLNFVKWTENSE